MHLTKAQIDDLKARLDLVEVIGSTVELKRQGRYFVGRCPFHADGKERTPSLIVNPAASLWNCRGACTTNGEGKAGAAGKSGGDAITFWEKLTGQGFPQACEDLAQRFSISLGSSGTNGNGAAGASAAAHAATNGHALPVASAPGYFSLEKSCSGQTAS